MKCIKYKSRVLNENDRAILIQCAPDINRHAT